MLESGTSAVTSPVMFVRYSLQQGTNDMLTIQDQQQDRSILSKNSRFALATDEDVIPEDLGLVDATVEGRKRIRWAQRAEVPQCSSRTATADLTDISVDCKFYA